MSEIDKTKSVDEILKAYKRFPYGDADNPQITGDEAKAQLYKLISDEIGEDETHWTDHFGHESNVPTNNMNARNGLRDEFRTALTKLFNLKEESGK